MDIDVFVSYHASNLHIVEKIVSKLENNGLNCWYASRDISGDYVGSITTAIKSCRVFILVLDKETGEITHERFYNIVNYLNENDILVLNNTKVIPARIYGVKESTGAKIELLILNNE